MKTVLAVLVVAICAALVAAQGTTVATQCKEAPSLIPDTFSLSYLQETRDSGVLYLTYIEPAWEEWEMFDIRELASDPFTATFTIDFTTAGLNLPTNYDLAATTPQCWFKTPQSYTRDNAATISRQTGTDKITVTFRQTGSLFCAVSPKTHDELRGKQQTSIDGTLNVRRYHCEDGTPTSSSEQLVVDGASKISMPDLYIHTDCTRTTFRFDAPYQLTSKQINGLALDISSLPTTVPNGDGTVNTILHSYTIDSTYMSNGARYYKNVLSFCTFGATLSESNNDNLTKTLFAQFADVQTTIKQSKVPSYCYNGKKDFDESDVDCGGSGSFNGCPPCVDSSQICNGNSDCVSGVCASHELAGKRCVALSSANTVFSAVTMAVVVIAAIVSNF